MIEEKPKLRYFDVVPQSKGFILVDPFSISKEMFLSKNSFLLLTLIDGKGTISDIKSKYLKITGIILSDIEIINFINALDQNFLLYNERFLERVKKEKEKIKNENFKEIKYGNNLEELKESISKKYFEFTKRIKGVIVPHIDLKAAITTYQKFFSILQSIKEKIIFVFGVPHFWYELPFSIFPKNFMVGEKIVESDLALIEKISKVFDYDITADFFAYKREHSIEFPVLFISFLNENKKVITSLVSESNVKKLKEISKKITEVLKDLKEDIFLISSIDLSHVGRKFGDEKSYDPEEVDKIYIDSILNLENEKAFELLEKNENRTRIDGKNTNFLFLEILKEFNIKKGNLIDYKKHYEELSDSIVTYALMVF
ncbi:MAG: AmmeMemoRadiSam system protein B [Candidatus Hydrothermales bacterium]